MYQTLKFIGYEVYRIEASGIIGSGDKQTTAPRYDHMAVGAKLDGIWYLCDIGWGGYMCQGAVEISEKVTENKRFSARCVQVGPFLMALTVVSCSLTSHPLNPVTWFRELQDGGIWSSKIRLGSIQITTISKRKSTELGKSHFVSGWNRQSLRTFKTR